MMDDYSVRVVRNVQTLLDRLLADDRNTDISNRIMFTLRESLDHGAPLDISALECAIQESRLRDTYDKRQD